MSKDSKIIKEIPVKGANANVIEVSVSYNIGGWNYFTGTQQRRGLYLHVTPINKSKNTRTYTGFSGIKTYVKEMKRFSKKQLEQYQPNDEQVQEMINHVVNKNQLTVIENED